MVEHNKHAPLIPEHKTPWWMDGKTTSETLKEPHFLADGVMRYWRRVREWLLYPLEQLDPETCSEHLLDVLAWGRDISRFKEEPLALFRKRVKYAFVNARDAGEVHGFIKIFARLGIGFVEVHERTPGRDWDVITIRLSDSQLAKNENLIAVLLQHYGRTCRRYEYEIITPKDLVLDASPLDWQHQCDVAVLEE
ncbi:TPA: phage tail protein [Vibrio parahaemolyticus]|uniref:Phage tail protein n=1 Tax=Vibrio parahaemolyticus TaxID=670 RepID=A0AA46Z816_VIBPH|nr:phage tail protein [Vibrio parahaemolyticus]EGR1734102.1 phage tail protein [Vibrio parahaemolyticus]EKB1966856.1 phage tail protein [Vibrio parahaemolyticus]MCC3847802.1 phage tail protein [Vibrio parahaemolyticus]UYV28884.1 phage tail protein [Vibrio parahaemolyticus]HBC3927676.1 phage tail protein [Vibrio parahaemolyticus]